MRWSSRQSHLSPCKASGLDSFQMHNDMIKGIEKKVHPVPLLTLQAYPPLLSAVSCSPSHIKVLNIVTLKFLI